LSDYLTSLHKNAAARAELLIASGNAPDNVHIDLTLGGKFEAMGETSDALNSYKKATVENPHNVEALAAAGRVSLESGDYEAARQYLDEAAAQTSLAGSERERVLAMRAEADRLFQLWPSEELPERERAEHLMLGKTIAEKRFEACSKQKVSEPSPALMSLKPRWASLGKIRSADVETNAGLQDAVLNLVHDTETITAVACGAPMGDDAYLLRLARQPSKHE
jgi:tetratricopeptide (TPR) repeat protein